MSTLGTVAFAENYDHLEVEQRLRTSWDRLKLYEFDPNSGKPVYSIDTPPPYVSAAHLHVGHAMSYAQAEFVVRYRRMRGYSIYYPMGFDDNGLPTERYVERTYKINKNNTTRSEFRRVCLEETAKGAAVYEKVWRALGLSVDWRERYSTIWTKRQPARSALTPPHLQKRWPGTPRRASPPIRYLMAIPSR